LEDLLHSAKESDPGLENIRQELQKLRTFASPQTAHRDPEHDGRAAAGLAKKAAAHRQSPGPAVVFASAVNQTGILGGDSETRHHEKARR
jgi:hypothetical protein